MQIFSKVSKCIRGYQKWKDTENRGSLNLSTNYGITGITGITGNLRFTAFSLNPVEQSKGLF